jgi:glycosyl hydrolase family 16
MSIILAPVSQILLQDNFSDNIQLNPSIWEINQYTAVNNPSYYGRTQIEQSLPVVSNGALHLTVQTYNPTGPGNSFLGSEAISKETFNNNAGGIAFTAIARIVNPVPGMVGGIFAYNYNSSTNLDNEIDFESLTNDATAQNNEEQTNIYGNQPLGAGNPAFVLDPSLTAYQTYTVEWFPNEVLWFINGQLVRQSTVDVPQGPMAFHLNFWAPDTGWADAYSASLLPTANPQDNQTYSFDVESLSVATVEDINTTLTITGALSKQAMSDTSSLSPFGNVVVTDLNPGATDTITVALSAAANGTLSNLGGGSYNATTGVYSDAGTAAAVTTALDGLVFTPTVQSQAVTTTFTIAATDSASASAMDNTTTVLAVPAPTLTTLVNFNGTSTGFPKGSLIADVAGDLFGTTTDVAPYGDDAGPSGYGTVFEIAKTAGGYSSTPTLLASFNFTDGANPEGGLIADAAGDLFGTTVGGGAYGIGTDGGVNGDGTVFEIAKTGSVYANTPTTLISFNGTDGANPEGSLVADAAGNLFGTTAIGGTNDDGTVFEIAKTAGGYASTPTTLVSFGGTNGEYPETGVIIDAAGDLFGTTDDAVSAYGYAGTVFEIPYTHGSYAATPTTLATFNGNSNGGGPSGLIADSAGDLFGVTAAFGLNSGQGTVFEIAKTASGYASTPTTLITFNGKDGGAPLGSLIIDSAGDLFGTTSEGGTHDWGTVFEIPYIDGSYASTPVTLVNLDNQTNGSDPTTALIAAVGHLFATTSTGGLPGSSFGNGTVFELSGTDFTLPTTVDDFYGNGISDVLFRNEATGDTGFYAISNGANVGWRDVGASSTAYSVVGVGDFNGDGTSDILYRNNTTGDTGFYEIFNGANTGWNDVGASSTAYSVAGVGDFNHDGTSDILYRNNTTGDTGFYAIVNGVNTGWHDVGASSTAYSVVGVGDFNGDGTSDILYRNNTTGDTGFYEIVNGANTGWYDVGASSTAYSVVGVGDFNGDGTSDILYRNNTTGDTGFYEIVNGINTGWHDVGASSTAYSVVGVGDYNGDGTSDILYRNSANGDTGFYSIVNGANTGWHDVGASSTAYHVAG